MAGTTHYKNDWQKSNLDRINLTVPKGCKEQIHGHASTHGESVNGFIKRAINEAIAHDQEKDARNQRIAQLAGESGKSIEEVKHDMEIEEALTVLQREVPSIRKIYHSEKQRQQVNRDIQPVTAIRGDN